MQWQIFGVKLSIKDGWLQGINAFFCGDFFTKWDFMRIQQLIKIADLS